MAGNGECFENYLSQIQADGTKFIQVVLGLRNYRGCRVIGRDLFMNLFSQSMRVKFIWCEYLPHNSRNRRAGLLYLRHYGQPACILE